MLLQVASGVKDSSTTACPVPRRSSAGPFALAEHPAMGCMVYPVAYAVWGGRINPVWGCLRPNAVMRKVVQYSHGREDHHKLFTPCTTMTND